MRLAPYIAGKMLRHPDRRNISRPIVRIAMWGIALGVALMILSTAVVTGFQQEVRNTVVGFGSHFQIVRNEDNLSGDSQPLRFSDSLRSALMALPQVRHVQVFALRPGILESKEGLQGAVLKGVDTDFDWTFMQACLKEGRLPAIAKDTGDAEVMLSKMMARKMRLQVGQKVSAYVLNGKDDARQSNLRIAGIYDTGLEDFDQKFVFTDIRTVRDLSDWGVDAQIYADSVCVEGTLRFAALGFGGSGDYLFQWNNQEPTADQLLLLNTPRDTTLRLIVEDQVYGWRDTATLTLNYLDDASTDYCRPFTIDRKVSAAPFGGLVGGYEVLIRNYEDLMWADDAIYEVIPFDLKVQNVRDRSPEIFAWLEMLDVNVIVISILMIVISIINMTSALLIIILERQNMIGTLKAFGMQNRSLMGVFFFNAMAIIGRGMLFGNLIGIGVALVQHTWHIIPLDPANYYVSTVPVLLSWSTILELNLLTFLICAISMFLPAALVNAITPIKAIRFS